ncbi:MAG: DUF2169 domain-containing protein [Deltaproteobacteria bacterium]|nr:DUF2169 domain-containing protein [Deltaproteobacteria bacterium]
MSAPVNQPISMIDTARVALLDLTPFPARLVEHPFDEQHVLALVIVRATYRFGRDGTVQLDRMSPIAPTMEPDTGPLGAIWPDRILRKAEVDVLVYGRAMARSRVPVRELMTSLALGDRVVSARVFGRRRWRRRGASIVMEGPDLFETIPLRWEQAFGGTATFAGEARVFKANPVGKGFVMDPAAVDGVELPNLEDPAQPIEHWSAVQDPRAFAPMPSECRLLDIRHHHHDPTDPTTHPTRWATTLTLNVAHPELRLPALVEGMQVTTQHMCPAGAQCFSLRVPKLVAELRRGNGLERVETKPLELDTLILYPDEWRYAVVGRCRFLVEADAVGTVVRLREGGDG